MTLNNNTLVTIRDNVSQDVPNTTFSIIFDNITSSDTVLNNSLITTTAIDDVGHTSHTSMDTRDTTLTEIAEKGSETVADTQTTLTSNASFTESAGMSDEVYTTVAHDASIVMSNTPDTLIVYTPYTESNYTRQAINITSVSTDRTTHGPFTPTSTTATGKGIGRRRRPILTIPPDLPIVTNFQKHYTSTLSPEKILESIQQKIKEMMKKRKQLG